MPVLLAAAGIPLSFAVAVRVPAGRLKEQLGAARRREPDAALTLGLRGQGVSVGQEDNTDKCRRFFQGHVDHPLEPSRAWGRRLEVSDMVPQPEADALLPEADPGPILHTRQTT